MPEAKGMRPSVEWRASYDRSLILFYFSFVNWHPITHDCCWQRHEVYWAEGRRLCVASTWLPPSATSLNPHWSATSMKARGENLHCGNCKKNWWEERDGVTLQRLLLDQVHVAWKNVVKDGCHWIFTIKIIWVLSPYLKRRTWGLQLTGTFSVYDRGHRGFFFASLMFPHVRWNVDEVSLRHPALASFNDCLKCHLEAECIYTGSKPDVSHRLVILLCKTNSVQPIGRRFLAQ